MDSNEVPSCPGYSDKQHKGSEGEGQFHLGNVTLAWHMKHAFVRWISYEELYGIFQAAESH